MTVFINKFSYNNVPFSSFYNLNNNSCVDVSLLVLNNNITSQRKRAAEPRIRGPYNSSKQSRYVELVLVVDNREFKEFNEDKGKVEQRCKQIANIINGV